VRISPARLIRWSGLASIAAGVLIAGAELGGSAFDLMNMELMAKTPLSATWLPLTVIELVGLMLMLLGFVGLYARQAEAAGWAGLLGFLTAFFGTSLFVGAAWENAFTPPVLATVAPAVLEIHPIPSPLGEAFFLSSVVFALGLVLFGVATLLARELPRGGAMLLIIGGALVPRWWSPLVSLSLGGPPVYLPIDALVTSLALIWLGYALWAEGREPSDRAQGGRTTRATLLERAASIRSVPSHVIVLSALASYAGQIIAGLQAWPLWAIVLATLIPWLPVFAREMVWTYRHYHWLALFYVLVVTQGGHFLEHAVQMTQIHILRSTGADARGIFGALDIEWVHFIWNSWVIIAATLLWRQFPRNPWLPMVVIIAAWHAIEHVYLMSVYLATGRAGTPGLLSQGGAIGGGLPLIRPDLHFLYNLIETIPLVMAFAWQLKHSYDEWLAKAFPHASEQELAQTTHRLQTLRYAAGDTVVRQGDAADRFYIITAGEVGVTRKQEAGQEVELATLGPGQFFGEVGLLAHRPRTASVRARTDLEVLALDREDFGRLVDGSQATAEDFAHVVRQRLATHVPPSNDLVGPALELEPSGSAAPR
jgi:hypothetical protein